MSDPRAAGSSSIRTSGLGGKGREDAESFARSGTPWLANSVSVSAQVGASVSGLRGLRVVAPLSPDFC